MLGSNPTVICTIVKNFVDKNCLSHVVAKIRVYETAGLYLRSDFIQERIFIKYQCLPKSVIDHISDITPKSRDL